MVVQTILILIIGGIATSPTAVDQVGLTNSVKRLRAWPETTQVIKAKLAKQDYGFVAADNRIVFYDLNYYGVGDTTLAMWSLNATPAHHASLTRALPETDEPVLLLSYHHNFEAYFKEDFETLEALPPVKIDVGRGKFRHLKAWRGIGYKLSLIHI